MQGTVKKKSALLKNLTNKEIALPAILFVGTLLYTLPWLSAFEFLRHTEADRTLIAWEMLRNNDLLIPRLYGEPYLTKPPLYYWLLAATFSLTGSVTEFTSRIVSGASLAVLSSLFFIFLRQCKCSPRFSIYTVLVFLSFGHIYDYSIKAEMDICHTLFCSAALGLGFLISQTPSRKLLALCLTATVGAALVKGPLVFFFYFLGISSFLVLERHLWGKNQGSIVKGLLLHSSLLGVAGAISCIWWVLVAKELGWDLIIYHFREELLHRFTGESLTTGHKPWHYYLSHLPGALLPWSLLLLPLISGSHRASFWLHLKQQSAETKKLVVFSVCAIIPAVFLLSLSGGKSNRYLMPLYPFIAILLITLGQSVEKKWKLFSLQRCITVLAALFFLSRIPLGLFYAPWKNARDSSKEVVSQIVNEAKDDKKIFLLETFERWIPFYLQSSGISVERLSPAVVQRQRALGDDKEILLFINVEDEHWRIAQLLSAGGNLKEVATLESRKHRWKLLRVQANQTWLFSPQKLIPTRPTLPDRDPIL